MRLILSLLSPQHNFLRRITANLTYVPALCKRQPLRMGLPHQADILVTLALACAAYRFTKLPYGHRVMRAVVVARDGVEVR
ncbi:hypothetical protein Pecwa_3332 [Pectobacterium parmentieri WPP163]|uniref:Uncharacterized protein n=1 Tax=Pectobacterium parmentieri TaxID=1905730 RepID=A0A0H3IBS2_PECPM|nr:hypothetical protein Pecwa_3332 [Pectobacterium parmentieri WPP163]AFI91404.1 Hypothetical protein W5S_3330 [Pectobacterium parmentieri]